MFDFLNEDSLIKARMLTIRTMMLSVLHYLESKNAKIEVVNTSRINVSWDCSTKDLNLFKAIALNTFESFVLQDLGNNIYLTYEELGTNPYTASFGFTTAEFEKSDSKTLGFVTSLPELGYKIITTPSLHKRVDSLEVIESLTTCGLQEFAERVICPIIQCDKYVVGDDKIVFLRKHDTDILCSMPWFNNVKAGNGGFIMKNKTPVFKLQTSPSVILTTV